MVSGYIEEKRILSRGKYSNGKMGLILLTILALFAVDGRVSYAFAEDEDTVGFVKSIEYGNFTVGLGIFNLSKLPAEVLNTLKELGLEKNVALGTNLK